MDKKSKMGKVCKFQLKCHIILLQGIYYLIRQTREDDEEILEKMHRAGDASCKQKSHKMSRKDF